MLCYKRGHTLTNMLKDKWKVCEICGRTVKLAHRCSECSKLYCAECKSTKEGVCLECAGD